jgi:hypothetical protein
MANNLQQLETQIQQMKEDKRKEISQLQQAKEQQLTSLNKLNSDQR